MKKLVVVAVAALSGIAGVRAQNVSFGPVVSFNHSWITGTSQADRQFNPGYKGGVALTYSIDPHWAIGADAVFSNEGVKTKRTVLQTVFTTKTNLDYIRIPLKASYFFGNLGDKFRPRLYVGPSLGFLIGGMTKTEAVTNGTVLKTETKSKDNFKSFDVGAMVGAGFNYRIGTSTWLNFDLNYTNGLLDVSKGEGNWNANRNYGMALGVSFPLGTFTPAK